LPPSTADPYDTRYDSPLVRKAVSRARDPLTRAGYARASLFLGLHLTSCLAAWADDRPTVPPGKLEEVLRPNPAKAFRDAFAALEIIDGFHIEVAAREPLVVDPVAAAIDEDGRLYVAELRDYPYRPKEGSPPLGRVRLLEDTDGDGRYDVSHIFAADLLWAAGIAPWKGGVYVSAPPDIWYFKDTDGDGVADQREQVFTGFGTSGAQYILNNLVWGIDHHIYASVAGNGGNVHAPGSNRVLALRGRRVDFRFTPLTGSYETISGGAQFGNTFDDGGNRFLCDQDDPLFHVVLRRRYLQRNPHLSPPEVQHPLATDDTAVFRASPVEPWRAIRSGRRVEANRGNPSGSGVSHHVLDGVAGTTIYRGHAFPEAAYGNAFSGDAQNNLVHRRSVLPDGISFASERLDAATEFIRSRDNWFRPVNFLNAPDGTLYVLDLAREILEAVHIPIDVVVHLDLTSGREHGRIWRVVPEGFRTPAPPRLGGATTAELVALLEHAGAWWRETAHRLLHEQQQVSAAPRLRELLRTSRRPQARLHALWSLAGLNELLHADLQVALESPHAAVREHAIRLSEPLLATSPELFEAVLARVDDRSARVRFQVTLSLGDVNDPRAVDAWRQIAWRDAADPWMRAALLTAPPRFLVDALVSLLAEQKLTAAETLVQPLSEVAGAMGIATSARILDAVAPAAGSARRYDIVLGLAQGLAHRGVHLEALLLQLSSQSSSVVESALENAASLSIDPAASRRATKKAVRLLGYAPWSIAARPLTTLLGNSHRPDLRVAAAHALAEVTAPAVGTVLLETWPDAPPALRQALLQAWLARVSHTHQLVATLEQGAIGWREIGPAAQQRLTAHADESIRLASGKLSQAGTTSTRAEVLAHYRKALTLIGDAALGKVLAKTRCLPCHRVGDDGIAIGPNLSLLSRRTPEENLVSILDPNHEVDPRYLVYIAVERDGRTTAGIVEDESEDAITLRTAQGVTTIPRIRLESLKSSANSFMPEGLEEGLDLAGMAALLSYLVSIRYDPGTSGHSPQEGELLPEY
jgi:putative membrane-bound dehydrogenase-like protein